MSDSPNEQSNEQQDTGDTESVVQELVRPTNRAFAVRNIFITGIFLVVVAAALFHGRSLLAPIAVALLLKFLFGPVVRGLERFRLPPPLGAAVVMVAMLGAVAGATYGLSAPLAEWLERAPRSLSELEKAAKEWRPQLKEIQEAADQVTNLTANGDSETLDVRIVDRPPLERAFDSTWPAVANSLIVLILLYFLLAGGDVFVSKLVESLPTMSDKKATVRTIRALESQISKYLITITIINFCLGLAVGLACYFAGLPNPILWGAMAAVFNFVPFLGAVAGTAVVALVSLSTFGSVPTALLAPAIYLVLSGLEGYLITPSVLGRNLSLSPVAVFVSMLFWGWAWGLIGVLVAVPMLVIAKISLSANSRTSTLGRFLGNE